MCVRVCVRSEHILFVVNVSGCCLGRLVCVARILTSVFLGRCVATPDPHTTSTPNPAPTKNQNQKITQLQKLLSELEATRVGTPEAEQISAVLAKNHSLVAGITEALDDPSTTYGPECEAGVGLGLICFLGGCCFWFLPPLPVSACPARLRCFSSFSS